MPAFGGYYIDFGDHDRVRLAASIPTYTLSVTRGPKLNYQLCIKLEEHQPMCGAKLKIRVQNVELTSAGHRSYGPRLLIWIRLCMRYGN